MPLFVDYHIVADITIDGVKKGHIADKAFQDRCGEKYLQFWVNQKARIIFCLIEAPDKKLTKKFTGEHRLQYCKGWKWLV